MKKMLRLEINKAFRNKFFLLAIVIGCMITLLSVWNLLYELKAEEMMVQLRYERTGGAILNPAHGSGRTLYSSWIWGEGFSLGVALYSFLFPVLLALPYGWSYCEEKTSGYARTIVSKSGKRDYFVAKYIATFLAGGCAMVLPLLFNFIITAMIVPATTPMARYLVFTGVAGNSLMSEIYYTKPLLYVVIYLCIDFVYAGLLASISFLAAFWIRWKWVCVISPFVVCMVLEYSTRFIHTVINKFPYEISPMFFLRPVIGRYVAGWPVILIGAVLLFLFTFVLARILDKHCEMY